MLTESLGRAATENHSGRDKQVPVVKDCRFTQSAFGTVVHDSSGMIMQLNLLPVARKMVLEELEMKQNG